VKLCPIRLLGFAVFVSGLLAPRAESQVAITRISTDATGVEGDGPSDVPGFSADGRWVAFRSKAENLVDDDTNQDIDVFVKDLGSGTVALMSVKLAGYEDFGGMSWGGSLSSDGRFVAYYSYSEHLVDGDTNLCPDCFVRDRDPDANGVFDEGNGTTTRVSVATDGTQANLTAANPRISDDGRIVVFESYATTLVPDDTNGVYDVYVRDLVAGVTTRVSVDSNGAQSNGASYAAWISADGRYVSFESQASNLVPGDTNGVNDVFVRDLVLGTTTRVSVDSSGVQGDKASSGFAPFSADARYVAFTSFADDLVPGDQNGHGDVFLRDLSIGTTTRVSLDSNGGEGNGDSGAPALSGDGSRVSFESLATNLAANDTNHASDVFVRDIAAGVTTLLSQSAGGTLGNRESFASALTIDGRFAAFTSLSDQLVPSDTNKSDDVFLVDLDPTPLASWTNYGTGFPGTNGIPAFTAESDPVLGTHVTLDLENSAANYTVGAWYLGLQRTSLPTALGGDLLVLPALTGLIGLSPNGATLFGDLPDDDALEGVVLDLQAMELDAGATHSVSFTAGLELVLGR
jgi:Tol biopolymer transport system component